MTNSNRWSATEDATALILSLPGAGGTQRARVIELAEIELIAVLDRPAQGTAVSGATLELPEIAAMQLPQLELVSSATRADGKVVARFSPGGPETRATMWLAVERLRWDVPTDDDRRVTGPLKEHERIPARGIYTDAARLERLRWLTEQTGTDLSALDHTRLQSEKLTGNIENFIGAIEVPVGMAGPLLFHGQHARGRIYAPFATSEGALVASATRGATAITRSGGVTTRVLSQRMMRVPLFVLTSVHGAMLFSDWVRDHLEELRAQTRLVSRHANLISVEPNLVGKMVHVSFLYETGDAAGQNMTTSCTWQACQWLMAQMKHIKEIVFENFLIEANVSGDKKANFKSFIEGRGNRVMAECVLDGDVVFKVLKVTPAQLAHANYMLNTGAVHVGMMGYNVNVANVIGAMFAATGQDIACTHESSLAHLVIQAEDNKVYASMSMPSIIVGTVGGGTHLPAQQALLRSMGCYGLGKVERLVEIIAGFCLALDLSTLSALATGEFASAHEKLGRNRPVRWLTREELTPTYFETAMREALDDPNLRVESAVPDALEMGSSIVTELTARKVNKLVGHFPFVLRYHDSSGGSHEAPIVVKVKPLDEEVVLMINTIAQMCSSRLAAAYAKYRYRTGFMGCHVRELGVYQQKDPRFTRHAPRIYGVHRDDAREAYVVMMEKLDDVVLMNSADDVRDWRPQHVESALRGIAQVHSIWYGREAELMAQPWLGPVQSADSMVEMSDLWDALIVHGAETFPEFVTLDELELMRALVRTLPEWWRELEAMPRTLIHNDFNPRNIALRSGDLRLCAYDWELATLHVPQHDLAELLCFVLPKDVDPRQVEHYLELHRRTLAEASGTEIHPVQWRLGYRYALRDLCINRIGQYLMAHTVRRYDFMKRVLETARTLLLIELEHANQRGAV